MWYLGKFPYTYIKSAATLDETEFPPMSEFTMMGGECQFGINHRRYTAMLATGLSSKDALATLDLKEIPLTAEEEYKINSDDYYSNCKTLRDYAELYNITDCHVLLKPSLVWRDAFGDMFNCSPFELNSISSLAWAQNCEHTRVSGYQLCKLDPEAYRLCREGSIGRLILSVIIYVLFSKIPIIHFRRCQWGLGTANSGRFVHTQRKKVYIIRII